MLARYTGREVIFYGLLRAAQHGVRKRDKSSTLFVLRDSEVAFFCDREMLSRRLQ